MSGLSCSRAKVAQNENLLGNDSLVLSCLVTQLQFSYRGRICDYTTHVRHGVSNLEQNCPINEVNLPRPMLQEMKKLLITKGPSDSNFPEGRNNQDLKNEFHHSRLTSVY